jgi:hypothetical protein
MITRGLFKGDRVTRRRGCSMINMHDKGMFQYSFLVLVILNLVFFEERTYLK